MNRQKTVLTILIIIIVLLAGDIFLGFRYFNIKKSVETTSQNQVFNDKILAFTQLFIDKVLKVNTEVDFETRLKLENSVRELDNKDILKQWQKFTASKTEIEAQTEVKNLLQVLISNIKVK